MLDQLAIINPGATIPLADGRLLGYAAYGDPGGWPLVFFHGTPGSRIFARLAAAEARARGIHLLAPERPGYGLSDPQPGRRLRDWLEDMRQLAAALELERFGVLGLSGGGPYAAACAWGLADKVEAAAIVSGVAPPEALAAGQPWYLRCLAAVVRRPWLTTPFLAVLPPLLRYQSGLVLAALTRFTPRADRALLASPDIWQLEREGLAEAWRQGVAATATDLSLFTQPWGFPLADIRVPVYLWYGEADRLVPVSQGRYLAERIPKCRARFIPNAGHLWILSGFREVLRTLQEGKQAAGDC